MLARNQIWWLAKLTMCHQILFHQQSILPLKTPTALYFNIKAYFSNTLITRVSLQVFMINQFNKGVLAYEDFVTK